jgi:glutamate-1-semialdehyde 2,1-aminomutase
MIVKENGTQFSEINKEASHYIAGGVVSINRKVSPHIVFTRGKGSKIYDITGKEYIDYHAAFAPYLLGHNFSKINEAVLEVIKSGLSLMGSGTNPLEIRLARLLCESVPSLDLVQVTNTGSEATAHAIRLARAWTNRDHIILTLGGYNGWHNEVARHVMPDREEIGPRKQRGEYPFLASSAGIPESTKEKVHIVNFNDLESVEYVLKNYPVACLLTEPVLQNTGIVLPKAGYLQGLIDLCEKYGAVCIFDEVKTGFRSALGGYQGVANVRPHLSVFGKAVANGYPIGVIGGRRDIMELFDSPDPRKRVLIAGTYNAHPINTAASIATIEFLRNPKVYDQINKISSRLYKGLSSLFREFGIPSNLSTNASSFCVYFCEKAPDDLHDILENHDFKYDITYRKALIEKGIYHFPIPCKQGSVSYAHSEEDIDNTLEATREVLKTI